MLQLIAALTKAHAEVAARREAQVLQPRLLIIDEIGYLPIELASGSPGRTDMRRGFGGLAALVQTALQSNAYGGDVFVFRCKRGDLSPSASR